MLNLASSFRRRQHVRSQPNGRRYWTKPGGFLVLMAPCYPLASREPPSEKVRAVAGEVGIWLSHLTAWHDIVEQGLPFALGARDDAALSAGHCKCSEKCVDRARWGGLGRGSVGRGRARS